ncbi:HAD family hydrolase [Candidatus Poribacteria bacterium]|nr:HAD family hydrolase [Candidatus Poribacteria bacterium]
MKYKAIIFDLFGTLVDMFPFQEIKGVLSEMAATLATPSDEFARLWTETFNQLSAGAFPTIEANIEDMFRTLGVQVEAGRITAAARIWLDFARRALAPRSDAVETLARLKEAGYKTGLISDCSLEVPLLWPETSFARLVEVTIFSCAVGLKKPDPRIYRFVCERLAVIPQNCLYVGDGSSHELTGAFQVGMHPVLIRAPYEDPYDAYRPDVHKWRGPTISALKEVLTLL